MPLLKIHWDAISEDKVSNRNSIWNTTPRDQKLGADELKELESLFAAQPTAKSTPTNVRASSLTLPLFPGVLSSEPGLPLCVVPFALPY